MKLVLGVEDFPYAGAGGQTTGDVADILEAKYHVMETFYEVHQGDIAGLLEDGVKDALESLMMGAPATHSPFLAACGGIDQMFHSFLDGREMESLGIPGVPTQAALDGKSSRFKSGKGKSRRPSFVDTGAYENSFTATIEVE